MSRQTVCFLATTVT